MLQFLPALNAAGIESEVASFFDDAYLKGVYADQKHGAQTLKYFKQRVTRMLRGPKPDVIWLEKELMPWLPWFVERALLPRGVPVVSDYDDAVFHRYDRHEKSVVRSILGSKIGRVMAASDIVFAGNPYLAGYAQAAGAKHVQVIPTVVDVSEYAIRIDLNKTLPSSVGWIGTPETWRGFARPYYKVLEPTIEAHDAVFRAVGADLSPSKVDHLEIIPWSESTEVSLIQSMDIGIMPLPDTPWSRGKCGYKLIQYMACGVPVIASPVGVNTDIVDHGVNGFLASTETEWADAVKTLLSNKDLRQEMGRAGRAKVEKHYSHQVYGSKVADLLLSAAHDQTKHR